jgi:mannose-6-phosphate isomerase-like protein (cupin superfamily)
VKKVNLQQKLSLFEELWTPKIVGHLNDYDIQIAKAKGEFVWHKHDETDELFLVLNGRLTIETPDGSFDLSPGELLVVPKGVEHRPRADDVVEVLLIEPAGTVNTGGAGGDMTAVKEPI